MALEIKGMIETSFLDWDGQIVTTLFVPKCNFRCPFCQNSALIERPDEFETIDFARIKRFLKQNKNFIDGVCLTGGEPLVYSDIGELISKVRDLGMKIKLDTNGSFPQVLNKLINDGLIEHIAMDIKAPLNQEAYERCSGAKINLDHLRESIELIMSSDIDYEFRTTVVPTLLEEKDILMICKDIEGAKKYVLQQFVPEHSLSPEFRKIKPYPRERIEDMVEQGRGYVKKMLARGLK